MTKFITSTIFKSETVDGIAIQYILDAYLPGEAPRAVFMSATPVTGTALEIVDLLNLLVPQEYLPEQKHLVSNDLFMLENGRLQWKEGALELVEQLAAGRVSFLLDLQSNLYPTRQFIGQTVELHGTVIPYLKFTLCPLSGFYKRTQKAMIEASGGSSAVSVSDYTIYDMVFPNPQYSPNAPLTDYGVGTYQSNLITTTLLTAPQDWLARAGGSCVFVSS